MLSIGDIWNPRDLASNETSDKDILKYTKNVFKKSVKQLFSLKFTSEELLEIINQNAILDS